MFDLLTEKFSSIFARMTGAHKLTENNINEALQKIRDALLDADVPQIIVHEFMSRIKTDVIGKKVLKSLSPTEQFIKLVYDQLVIFLSAPAVPELTKLKNPAVLLVAGLQGSGKTTSIAKLAYWLKQQRPTIKIVTVSLDFNRPAAREQLKILADSVGISYYHTQSVVPEKAARELMGHVCSSYDLTIIDTAGRLHVDQLLLEELRTVVHVTRPACTLLVLDAMTGQESVNVARAFQEILNFDGVVLSKIDSDTRAGASFACVFDLKKPIIFMGTGEKVENLEPFAPERIARRMLGMGDLDSLLERANARIKIEEQEAALDRMRTGQFTLNDFAAQIDMMGKLGSLGSLVKYLPGVGKIDPALIQQGQKQMTGFRAIINSMTPKERIQPAILGQGRIVRVARGAGVKESAVRELLVKFEQTQQFVKLLSRK